MMSSMILDQPSSNPYLAKCYLLKELLGKRDLGLQNEIEHDRQEVALMERSLACFKDTVALLKKMRAKECSRASSLSRQHSAHITSAKLNRSPMINHKLYEQGPLYYQPSGDHCSLNGSNKIQKIASLGQFGRMERTYNSNGNELYSKPTDSRV